MKPQRLYMKSYVQGYFCGKTGLELSSDGQKNPVTQTRLILCRQLMILLHIINNNAHGTLTQKTLGLSKLEWLQPCLQVAFWHFLTATYQSRPVHIVRESLAADGDAAFQRLFICTMVLPLNEFPVGTMPSCQIVNCSHVSDLSSQLPLSTSCRSHLSIKQAINWNRLNKCTGELSCVFMDYSTFMVMHNGPGTFPPSCLCYHSEYKIYISGRKQYFLKH